MDFIFTPCKIIALWLNMEIIQTGCKMHRSRNKSPVIDTNFFLNRAWNTSTCVCLILLDFQIFQAERFGWSLEAESYRIGRNVRKILKLRAYYCNCSKFFLYSYFQKEIPCYPFLNTVKKCVNLLGLQRVVSTFFFE